MKLCPSCNKDKALDLFNKDKKGKYGVSTYCKECAAVKSRESYKRRSQDKEWYAAYREGYAEQYRERKKKAVELMGGQCADCGGVFPTVAYDFHHIDPSQKDMNPSKAMTLSEDKMLEELSKCVLLCSNCHRIRHWHFEGGY